MFTYHHSKHDNRLSLVIVGGFLGSGKTTLLNLALQQPGTKLLINDLGDTAPDLAFMDNHIHLLLGGCACCDKRDELVSMLRDVCSTHHKHPDQFDRVILEMSGLADPANVLAAIDNDPVLTANVRIDDVITTIDAARGVGDLIHEPLARKQLQQCDKAIITKVDLADDKQLETIYATTLALNPGAKVSATAFGKQQELPVLNPSAAVDIMAIADADDEPVHSVWISSSGAIDWTAFALWFGSLIFAHQHDILRVKGLLRTPRGLVIVHAARGVIGVPTISAEKEALDDELGLLFLVRHITEEQLLKSWEVHGLGLPYVDIPAVDDLLEIKTMLTEHSRSWTHQWKAEGLKEGRQEGRLEGASTIVLRLLQRKFGTLPPHIEQRLKQATPTQLETWSLNVLDADNLNDVFT